MRSTRAGILGGEETLEGRMEHEIGAAREHVHSRPFPNKMINVIVVPRSRAMCADDEKIVA
jgi:hypothetical protein